VDAVGAFFSSLPGLQNSVAKHACDPSALAAANSTPGTQGRQTLSLVGVGGAVSPSPLPHVRTPWQFFVPLELENQLTPSQSEKNGGVQEVSGHDGICTESS